MKHYLLIFGILLISAKVRSDKINVEADFSCDSDDPKKFYIKGLPLRCNDSEVCNLRRNYKENYCIDLALKSKMCNDIFTCHRESKNVVNVGGFTLKCAEYHECNVRNDWPCKPCVPSKCEVSFTCSSSDPTLVTFNNMQPLICDQGYVCNKDQLCPGNPCIKSNHDVPTLPEPVCGDPLHLNCNDGYADKYPCRRAPTGFYYKCFKTTSYDFELKSCHDLSYDAVCKDVKCIC